MGSRITLLFSSAGRRAQLIACFRRDATALGVQLRVIATDVHPELSAACQLADASYSVPRCTDAGFVDALLAVCRRERVDLVIPTIDTELPILSRAAAELQAYGSRVVLGSGDIVAMARDKLKTAEVLRNGGVPVPRTALLPAVVEDSSAWSWPLILKPRGGSSSIGLINVDSPSELLGRIPGTVTDYIAQERWAGAEYTVNMFFDQYGKLQCTIPHCRLETRGGEVSKGRTERLEIFSELARRMELVLPGARGPMCFQAIKDDQGRVAVFEINARFGGGFPLAHQAGAVFSRWLMEEHLGLPSTANDHWDSGVLMLRYDAAIFTR